MNDDPQALVGQVVAERYEVQALLGVGGMGSVYRARHVRIRKLVALKTLHASMLRSAEIVARFEREAVASARIDHPNVVVVTDFGRLPNGRYFLVMEYVEGRNLRDELEHRPRPALPRVLHIIRQITSALAAAHRLGIVHRDLKPENVMLVQRGPDADAVKVLDFGIAKMTLEDKSQPLTQLGAIFGTPQYMSPEQAGGRPVDARSDLYSLGVICYEMLATKLPFDAADALGFIVQHLNAVPAPLPAEVPEPIRELVMSLLHKAPEQRPASADVLLAALDRLAIEVRPPSIVRARSEWFEQRAAALRFALTKSRRIGKLTMPTGIWLLVFASLSVLLVLLLPQGVAKNAKSTTGVDRAAAAEAPSSALPTLSAPEFTEEIQRIEQLKVYQRTERDWMLLARGSAKLARFEQSALAYQALLSLRADLRKDPGLLHDLRNAVEDPKAFRIVLNLAETVLGRHGVDLIWLMWEEQRLDPARKEQTEKLAKKLVILSHSASPALRVAIELTFAQSCEKLLGILGRAATVADSRSLERLNALTSKTGCGATKTDDCYPCLREGELLEQASARAKQIKAPELGQTAED